jgi:2-polyprenyl-3-methyl-5-hydroxy-6-metoxy-1,4-benzoquinol methylase
MTDFDAKARGWDDVPGRKERAEAVAKAIRREVNLSNKMSALEYGCGTGLLSFALQPFPGSITLADSSPGMLKVLQEKIDANAITNMKPILLDLVNDPMPIEKYDLIYTLMTLHHITDTQSILGKFHSMLKPGGILCISDLEKEDGTFHTYEFHGHHGFDRQELLELLINTGFISIRFMAPYIVNKDARSYPLFLAVGGKI